jgi:hypothetical protein
VPDNTFPSSDDLIATPGWSGSSSSDGDDVRRVLETVDALREEFRERDALLEMTERVIFLQNAVDIPQGYRKTALEVRSPLPTHIVNTITSALSVNPPAVGFDPVGIGDQAWENQALRQSFFDASWLRQEEEAKRPLFRQATHSAIAYGEAILKTTERKKRVWSSYNGFVKKLRADLDKDDALDDDSKDKILDARTEEFKRGAAYPIASTDVPPGQFYYIKGEDGFTLCAEVKQVPYLDCLERWPDIGINRRGDVVEAGLGLPIASVPEALGDRRTLDVIELWDPKTVRYLVRGARQAQDKKGDGRLVRVVKHGYGDPDRKVLRGPYFHAMGITTSSRDLAKQSQSVLFAFLHLFPLLDRLLTIRGQAAFTYGFGAFKRALPPGASSGLADAAFGVDAAEQSAGEEEIRPGYVYPYDIAPIDMPRSGIDLDKAITDVRAMIELALPSVAQGVIGGESGYAINQAAHLARLAWNPIIANLEQMLSERVGFESWLIEHRIKEKVWVYGKVPDELSQRRKRLRSDEGWLGIDASELAGLHRYRVKLKPETPSNEVIKTRMIGDQLQMGLISQRMAIEEAGYNAVAVKREKMLEALQADPAIVNLIKQGVFQQLGTLQAEAMQGVDAAPPGPGAAAPPPPDAQQQMAPVDPAALAAAANGQGPPGMPVPQAPVTPGAAGPIPGTPGTVPGAPGGIRSYPSNSMPLPGQG